MAEHPCEAERAPPCVVSSVMPAAFRHGFTTRAGGVSPAPFDTLNLGMSWGDRRDNVLENRRRVMAVAGVRALHVVRQVHGSGVLALRAGDDPEVTAGVTADAVCAETGDVAVAVLVADCVPLLFADPRTGAFAAAHAGWRGTLAGVAEATVAALGAKFGSRPADLLVALGPAIGACCFEVGPEVAAAFRGAVAFARGLRVVIERPGRRPHVDLRLALRILIERAGVAPEAIDAAPDCTRCDPGRRFFSYRSDGARTGQQFGFVARTDRGVVARVGGGDGELGGAVGADGAAGGARPPTVDR